MAHVDSRFQLGQIVRILRGREAGEYAIVIGLELPHYVWLADGWQRVFDRPKKKNDKHIQPTKEVSTEVATLLKATGRISNEKLRDALNQYLLRQLSSK